MDRNYNESPKKLEELKKKLYRKGAKFEGRPKADVFSPGIRPIRPGKSEPDYWTKKSRRKPFSPRQKLAFWLVSGSIILILASVGIVFFWQGQKAFSQEKVVLKISAPREITAGDEVNFKITYRNETKVSLKEAELVFQFPQGAEIVDKVGELESLKNLIVKTSLGNLAPGSEGVIEQKARIFGSRDSTKVAGVKLVYRPENINSQFTTSADFGLDIKEVPFLLNVVAPEKAVDGQEIEYALNYVNKSEADFLSVEIRAEYPAGFDFISAEPLADKGNNIWQIDSLKAGGEGEILVRGIISGEKEENKLIKLSLGVAKEGDFVLYEEVTATSQITISPLAITQAIDSGGAQAANAGDVLNFSLNYKNTTDVGISGIVITAKLTGEAFDFESLETFGNFNEAARTITWNNRTTSKLGYLKSDEGGVVDFTIEIKKPLPIENFGDKNFTLTSNAEIDTVNIPAGLKNIPIKGEHNLVIKVNSEMDLSAKGYYATSLVANKGPIPPRVGEVTTYAITWQLTNASNEVKNVLVKAKFPSGVSWEEIVEPETENIRYDNFTGEVRWEIANLPAGTGILLPARQVAFKVAIEPSSNQVGQLIKLVEKSILTAEDSFTGTILQDSAETIFTDLPDDPTVGWNNGRVVK